jgi:hypothetical protein
MASLAEIRARLQAQDTRSTNQGGGDKGIYPHWNIPEGTTAKVRFLPDGDSSNDFFWVERAMIKLPFAGVKGQMDSKPVTVQVPCVEMWGETCPVLSEVRPWFKDKNLEELGRKYWKKRSYVFQGFVRENPMNEDGATDNPIRRFIIGPQIFNVVKAALMDSEIEELPTHVERGLDFQITKTSKGGYADYSTSKWARKETALTNVEAAAIEAHGLFNLKDFLPKKPTTTELQVIKDMFEASVDGQAYDPDRWGNYYKPPGLNVGGGRADVDEDAPRAVSRPAPSAPRPAPAASVDEDDIPFESTPAVATDTPKPAAGGNARAEDILAMIRARQK